VKIIVRVRINNTRRASLVSNSFFYKTEGLRVKDEWMYDG
jgi:hypothetical protein